VSDASAALAAVRRARSAARRERQSLGDALYVLYVTALFVLYGASALGARATPAPGPLRSSAALAEPLLLCLVALGVVLARAVSAVRGGPVVLPPEEARVLLTWPIPRRLLVQPALVAAVSRSLAGAVLASALLLYVDVHDLGAPARAVLLDDLLLPALVAVLAVLVAWQVQLRPRLGLLLRPLAVLAGLAAAAGVALVGRELVRDGTAPGLRRLALRGPDPASLPFGGAAGHAAPSPLAVLVLLLLVVALGLLGLAAASRVSAEELLARSRRADVTRTALKLGFTSAVYLSRTEAARRSRRRRWSPRARTVFGSLLSKASVQEQGAAVLPRLLAAAVVVGTLAGAAAHVTPGRGLAATLAWGLVGGVALGAIATRFADPVRLDVDRAPLAGSLPVPLLLLARADLTASGLVVLLGGVIGIIGDVSLGVVPAAQVPVLVGGALAVAVLSAGAGALGALSDDPSPLLPAGASIGYRASGLIATALACGGAGLALRLSGQRPGAHPVPGQQLTAAITVVAVVAAAASGIAAARAASALKRGR